MNPPVIIGTVDVRVHLEDLFSDPSVVVDRDFQTDVLSEGLTAERFRGQAILPHPTEPWIDSSENAVGKRVSIRT